ncbi:MAG: PIN domain-containing protein [Nitrospinae bacterium]|nr:PIN domain-containing protein [Nitrospinota bacterium]
MGVLLDTSVWIDYFKGGIQTLSVDYLIDNNQIVTNELILAELLPYIEVNKERKLATLLKSIKTFKIKIDWDEIIRFQVVCLQNGLNKIGIPDLIIVQNALQNNLTIYSLDKHFPLICESIPFNIYETSSL